MAVVPAMLARPLGTQDVGREHDTWCNLNEEAHRWNLLNRLNVKVGSGVTRTAVPHFQNVAEKGGPSGRDDHFRVGKYVAMPIRRSGKGRPLTTNRQVVSIR